MMPEAGEFGKLIRGKTGLLLTCLEYLVVFIRLSSLNL